MDGRAGEEDFDSGDAPECLKDSVIETRAGVETSTGVNCPLSLWRNGQNFAHLIHMMEAEPIGPNPVSLIQ